MSNKKNKEPKWNIELSKDAWHYKLQTEVFDFEPNFTNFCPYFWLTIFCVIVFPFLVALGVLKATLIWSLNAFIVAVEFVFYPIARLAEAWLRFLDRNLCIPIEQKAMTSWNESSVRDYYHNSREYYMKRNGWNEARAVEHMHWMAENDPLKKRIMRKDAKFRLWKKVVTEAGEKWEDALTSLFERLDKLEALQNKLDSAAHDRALEFAKDRAAKKKKLMINLAIWTQKAMPFLLGLLAILVIYVLSHVLPMVWTVLKVIALGFWLVVTGIWGWLMGLRTYGLAQFLINLVLTSSVAMLIVYFAISFTRKCDFDLRPYFNQSGTGLDKFLKRFIVAPIMAISEFCEFVVAYVKLFKKDYCPQITWTKE